MVRGSPPGGRTCERVGVQTRSLNTALGGWCGKLVGRGALGGPGPLPFRLVGVAVGRGHCRGLKLVVVSNRVQVPALRPRALDTEAARPRDRNLGERLLELHLGCGQVPELALAPRHCRRPQHPSLHRAGEGGGRRGWRSRRVAHCARAPSIGWCDEQDHLSEKKSRYRRPARTCLPTGRG